MSLAPSRTPARVRVRVPAKINLHLAVGDTRGDGYHQLVTVFHAVDLADELTIEPAPRLSVRTTPAAGVPTGGKNLAAVAARALAAAGRRRPAVAISIDKKIPVAGGMAGGSADAAGVLVGCAALWGLEITRDKLADIAAEVGSDVPFALTGGTAVGTGRGHRIAPVLSRMPLHWALALSGTGLSTPAVFAELDRLRATGKSRRAGPVEDILGALASGSIEQVAAALANDLSAAAISLRPGLRVTLRAGLDAGALGGIISGSGPTVALLCRSPEHATQVAADLSSSGTCAAVRVAAGPAPGARVIGTD